MQFIEKDMEDIGGQTNKRGKNSLGV